MVMVNIVEGEENNFSRISQEVAYLSKWSYGMMGFPSNRYSNNMVWRTRISNFPVAPDNIMMDDKI